MFERDYLVKMIAELVSAIRRSIEKSQEQKDADGAVEVLENAITNATELDGAVLMTLSPDSIAQVLKVSNTDPRVIVYIAHSMLLQSEYLRQIHLDQKANLREQQAKALAEAYNFELPKDISTIKKQDYEDEDIEDYLESLNLQ